MAEGRERIQSGEGDNGRVVSSTDMTADGENIPPSGLLGEGAVEQAAQTHINYVTACETPSIGPSYIYNNCHFIISGDKKRTCPKFRISMDDEQTSQEQEEKRKLTEDGDSSSADAVPAKRRRSSSLTDGVHSSLSRQRQTSAGTSPLAPSPSGSQGATPISATMGRETQVQTGSEASEAYGTPGSAGAISTSDMGSLVRGSQRSSYPFTRPRLPTLQSQEVPGTSHANKQGQNIFDGQTMEELFGPFCDIDELVESSPSHKVRLYGEIVEKFEETSPNPLSESQVGTGLRCRSKKYLALKLKVLTKDGSTIFRLISFLDGVNRQKSKFKKGQMHIICGVRIIKATPHFNDTNHEFEGVVDKAFVHGLSKEATLKSPAVEELASYVTGRIPLINLKADKAWPVSTYIQGEVIFKKFTNKSNPERIDVIIRDQSGTLKLVAFGTKAKQLNAKGAICIGKKYTVEKRGGTVAVANTRYSETSLSVELKVGMNTRIELAAT